VAISACSTFIPAGAHVYHRQSSSAETNNYHLSVGAPGEEEDSGVVYTFDMSRRVVRSYDELTPHEGRPGSRFGSAIAYTRGTPKSATNSTSLTSKRLIVGSATAIYAINVASRPREGRDSGSPHRSSSDRQRLVPIQHARAATSSLRPVAMLGELDSSRVLPLMWLSPHPLAASGTALTTLGKASIATDNSVPSRQGEEVNTPSPESHAFTATGQRPTDREKLRTIAYCLTAAMLSIVAVYGGIRCRRSRCPARLQKDSTTFNNL